MTRKLKALGLALVAVFAMSVVASGAQASVQLDNEKSENVNMSGGQKTKHSFTVDGNAVECNVATFNTNAAVPAGGAAGVDTTMNVHPSYNGCKAFTFLNATVTTTNCNYEGHGVSNINASEWNAALTVNCNGTTVITIVAGTCEATVDDQTINNGLSIKNTDHGASHMNFDITATNAPVEVNRVKDGIGCPFNTTGLTTGNYNGTTEMECKNGSGTVIDCTLTNMA